MTFLLSAKPWLRTLISKVSADDLYATIKFLIVLVVVLPLLPKGQISNLFRCKTTYERSVKDGHKFRLQCAELLAPDLAALVIDKLKDRDRNGIVKSKSVIEWKAA